MRSRMAAVRERIVAAALEQVATGGYGSATIAAVAGRAGVATGTVYNHFGSKSEVLAEVFRRASARELAVIEEIASAPGEPPTARLARCVEAFARRALAGPVLAYAQIAEPVGERVEEERLALRLGYRDVFARLLAEGVAVGELPPQETEVVAAGLVGGIGEALVGPLSPTGRPVGRDRLVAALRGFALRAAGASTAA
jgi:AcrR family transcriptional regulator